MEKVREVLNSRIRRHELRERVCEVLLRTQSKSKRSCCSRRWNRNFARYLIAEYWVTNSERECAKYSTWCIWMSRVAYMNKSWLIYEWVMSGGGSFLTYGVMAMSRDSFIYTWAMTHSYMQHDEWVMSRTWMSHGSLSYERCHIWMSHGNAAAACCRGHFSYIWEMSSFCMNESWLISEWVLSRTWMSHGPLSYERYPVWMSHGLSIYEKWVMTHPVLYEKYHIWMSHGLSIYEQWVMTHPLSYEKCHIWMSHGPLSYERYAVWMSHGLSIYEQWVMTHPLSYERCHMWMSHGLSIYRRNILCKKQLLRMTHGESSRGT